jgi:hypothetical protein
VLSVAVRGFALKARQPYDSWRLVSNGMAMTLVEIKQGCCASRNVERRQRRGCNMNTTATIARAGPQHMRAGPQHMRALQRANHVRLARAALKRRVAIGEVEAADVILDCPWEAQSMAVADLLMSQRRWGQMRCHKILAQLPVTDHKTLGSMTDRQRRALAAILGDAGGNAGGAPV